MRNWVGSEHFPENARINIQTEIGEGARNEITDEQSSFLVELSKNLRDCEWDQDSVSVAIRNSIGASEVAPERSVKIGRASCRERV